MKIIYLYLFVLLFLGNFILSCTMKKNDVIFEKEIKEFIIENKNNMDWFIEHDSVDNMIIYINKIFSLRPSEGVKDTSIKEITYPNLDLYILSYANFYIENEVVPPPSKLFYIGKYPVMLYDPEIPSIDSGDIPRYLHENDKLGGSNDEWLLGICKKTHKYIVIRDSYNKGDNTIKELNAFSCEDE